MSNNLVFYKYNKFYLKKKALISYSVKRIEKRVGKKTEKEKEIVERQTVQRHQ